MRNRLLIIVCCVLAFLPGIANAIAYAPIANLSDLRQGDRVVIAIQNGRYSTAWYALYYNPMGSKNATSITVKKNAITTKITNDMIWDVQVSGNIYTFYNIYNGHTYNLLANDHGWNITQIIGSNRYIISSNETAPQEIIWRVDNQGSRFDLFNPIKDSIALFDQVEKKANLSTGAYALNIFKPTNQVVFDGQGKGTPFVDVDYANSDGEIMLPKCASYAHFRFLGWASTASSEVADVGKEGTLVQIDKDTTFYAVYSARNVSTQCFDYTQLSNPDVCTCRTGTHSVSTYETDEGWTGEGVTNNRHTVNTKSGKDSKVSQLSILPPGETSSIRLGNSGTGAQKERISYVCEVDTMENAVLMIKWACVMENPGHTESNQPRFELKIKDEFEQLIDPECGYFNFSSGYNTDGWTKFSGGLWKDWTTMSLDLTPYHGRRITIEFTTYDCTQSGHFGYGYFHLSCLNRSLEIGACAKVGTTIPITAPDGFYYHWYRKSDEQDFGTDRVINVPVDGDSYICKVATKADGGCSFDLEATPVPYYPIAAFDAHVLRGLCADTLILTNNSFVTSDGIHPVVDRPLDDIKWDFGRGPSDTWDKYDAPDTLIYNTPGKYHVSLYTGMDGWLCVSDEASFDFTVEANQQYQHFYDTICLGDSFEFRGKMFKPERKGTHNYFDTIRTAGCFEEILVEEHLYVASKYTFMEEDTICWDEQYEWHGQTITQPGVYYDSLLSSALCDSIYILTLHQNPQEASITYLEDTICEGDYYYWNTNFYTEAGRYKQHFVNQYGCDSTVVLDLVVRGRYDDKPVSPIKPSTRPIYWDDPYWTDTTGTEGAHPSYWDDPYWTDTVHHTGVRPDYWTDPYVSRDTVIPPHRPGYWDDPYVDHPRDVDTICEGDVYMWHDIAITEAGVYADTLQTIYGCDSIVYITIYVQPSPRFYEEQIINQGQHYTWVGHHDDIQVSEPGYYFDSLTTVWGCDSIYTLLLIVNGPYETTYLDTICQGDSLAFTRHHGTEIVFYHMPGEYTDTLSALDGTDSISHVRLTVNPKSFSMTEMTICEGDSAFWNGKYWHNPITTQDTLVNEFGCDSVAHFKLSVLLRDTFITIDTICSSEKFVWNGKEYNASAQDTAYLKNQFGCDSVDILSLYIIPPVMSEDTMVACDGDSIFFYGQWVKETGDYQKVLTSLVTHCDSIYTLHAVISNTADTTITDSICQGDSLRGVTYTTPGTYYLKNDTLARHNDCDSIVRYIVVVSPTYEVSENATICAGDSVEWHGKQLRIDSTYIDTLLSQAGCDSICTFVLTVVPVRDSVLRDTVCYGSSYSWMGVDYAQLTADTTLIDTIPYTTCSCDSIHLSLSIMVQSKPDTIPEEFDICKGDTMLWHGQKLYEEKTYYDTTYSKLPLHCDSIYHSATVYIYPTQYKDSSYLLCQGDSVWFGKQWIKTAGEYIDTLHHASVLYGCDSITTLTVTVLAPTFVTEDTVLCYNSPIIWRGHQVDSTGIYLDTLYYIREGVEICDSVIYTLNALVYPEPQYHYTSDTLCESDSYTWTTYRDTIITESGTYHDTLWTDHGCYSDTYELKILFSHPDTTDTTAYVCYGDMPYEWHGKTLTGACDTSWTTKNIAGCDSVIRLHLFVSPEPLKDTTDTAICEGSVYMWRGHEYTAAGTYYDTTKVLTPGLTMCDSIWHTLQLGILYATDSVTNANICEGESFDWYGHIYTTSKDTAMTLVNAVGCDSVCSLHLIVRTTDTTDTTAYVCYGDMPYEWHGKTLTGACDTSWTTKNITDCDSVIRLHLFVSPEPLKDTTNAAICEGSVYMWRGHEYTTAGTYYDTAHYTTGCDSVWYTLTLSYNQPTKGDTIAYACYDDLPYYWHNNIAQDSDTWITTNAAGCDSVVYLHLIVSSEPQTEHADTTICMGDMIEWHGQTIVTEGTYYDTARVTMGNGQLCDSIWYELAVTIQKSDTTTNNISICTGGEYVWKRNGKSDRVISEAGEYWDTVRYVRTDCDSMIYHLTLQIEDINRDSISDKTCAGIPYLWRGRLLEVSGVYRDTAKAKTETECDTIYTLLLTINQPTSSDTTATACDSFTWHGVIYTESTNEPIWTTTNAAGCDSVITLHLTIHKSGIGEESKTICDKQLPFTWKGQEYNEAGDYTFDTLTVHGCDSVITLHLHVDTYTTGDTTATACESFTWHGRTYTESTDTATWTTINAAGCDSVVTLHLTINHATSSEMTIQICDEELPYTWNGKDYTAEGDYTYQTINAAGCDSTATLHLKVIRCCPDTVMRRQELTICDTLMPYTWVTWREKIIEETGSYTDTLRNDLGCDSIIYTLKLDTFHCCAPLVVDMHIDDICADAPTLPVILNLNGGEIYEYSVHFTNPVLNKMPLRDTTARIETVYASEEPVQWDIPMPSDPNDRRNYPRPDDTYAMDLVVRDVCGDSMVWTNVPFSILYPSWVTDQHWDDVIALLNDRYNGGYTFSAVQWLRNGEVLLGEDNNLYIYLPHELWTNSNHERQDFLYQALLTRTDDGKTIPTCPLEPRHIDNTNVLSDPYISVTPTLVPKENPVVHVMTNTEGTYWVYDMAGKLLQTGDYEPCEHSVFDINLYHVQTMYILVFTPRNEKKPLQHKYSVVKVLVE